MPKKALLTSSSENESVSGTSIAASQVWVTKNSATSTSAQIIAMPAERRPPLASSESVAMPSKPRKHSTAIESAVPIRPGLNSAESKSGLVVNSAPLVPWTIAMTAITMKIATKTSSAARNSRLTIAVNEMPT